MKFAHPFVRSFLPILISAVFILSGGAKLFSVYEFTLTIREFVGIPPFFIYSLALVICISEIVLGIFILLSHYRLYACGGIIIITFFFTALQIYVILQHKSIECFCFGTLTQDQIGWETIMRNMILILCSWVVLQYSSVRQKIN
jgi:hypothetical protein